MITSATSNNRIPQRDLINRPAGPGGNTASAPSGPQDTVTLSSESQVADARCNNNWRCLKALHDRGLLT